MRELFQALANWKFAVGQILGPAYAMEKLAELTATGRTSLHYISAERAEHLTVVCRGYGLIAETSQSGINENYVDVDITLPLPQ